MSMLNFSLKSLLLVCAVIFSNFLNSDAVADGEAGNHSIHYPDNWHSQTEHPIFPSPENWFQYRQIYLYQGYTGKNLKKKHKALHTLKGYGKFEDPEVFDDLEYEKITWIDENKKENKQRKYNLVRIDYRDVEVDKGQHDLRRATWYSRGFSNLPLKSDIIAIDYPLVLGKRWESVSKMAKIKVSQKASIVAYIPPSINSISEIVVAPGEKYTLPFPVAKIPAPLAEQGNLSIDELKSNVGPDAYIDWSQVQLNPTEDPNSGIRPSHGYYVIRSVTKWGGKTVRVEEFWKDIRGAVPVYHERTSFPLSVVPRRTTKIAVGWTGNEVD